MVDKSKDFVRQLASYPPSIRYKLPKHLWKSGRLGLFQTIMDERIYAPHRSNYPVKIIAAAKRRKILDEDLQDIFESVLLNSKFKHIHLEFVKETIYLYPDFYLAFFDENREWLVKAEYLSLFLALIAQQDKIKEVLHAFDFNVLSKKNIEEVLSSSLSIFLDSNIKQYETDKRLELLNHSLENFGLLPVFLKDRTGSLQVNNIDCEVSQAYKSQQQMAKSHKVSVLVTSYNSQDTIAFCLESLLCQTWRNIQVIVIDDASTDATTEVVQKFVDNDTRVLLIKLSRNVGTFVAKSIGAMQADGEFLTCQDSDDWAHPQKIQMQVEPLINNPHLIASTSFWLRLDEEGRYFSRKLLPLLTQNPASPLFRRGKVEREIGLWHLCRTGADSEFFDRMKLIYGRHKIHVIRQPLTIASHRANSLMTSNEFGAYHADSAMNRLDYWESWKKWHIDEIYSKKHVRMPSLAEQLNQPRLFQVPEKIRVQSADVTYNLQFVSSILNDIKISDDKKIKPLL